MQPNLLAKYLSENTTEDETRQVHEWRNENPSEFMEFKRAWVSSYQPEADPEKLAEIIGTTQTGKGRIIPFNWSATLRYAASVLLVIAVGIIGYVYFGGSGSATPYTSSVKLEDGTKVILYKDASITEIFTKDLRRVEVTGKAYFDVKRDEDRPFEILTSEAKITVLGTSFIVDAAVEHTTEVIVESGVVSFSQNPERYAGRVTSIKLYEGDMGIIKPQAKGLIKRKNRDENYLAWANQVLTFKRADLGEVGALVKEVYGYDVVISKELERCKLTATYSKKSPKEIARLISETFGITHTLEGNTITFSGPGC